MDDDTSDLLLKADAFMRRGRSYVASVPTMPQSPVAEAASPVIDNPATDDDIPVLTEKVAEGDAAYATAPPHMQQHLDALREELARWLEQELPHAVLKVTDGLADQLMAELTHQAERNLLPRLIARLDGTGRAPG